MIFPKQVLIRVKKPNENVIVLKLFRFLNKPVLPSTHFGIGTDFYQDAFVLRRPLRVNTGQSDEENHESESWCGLQRKIEIHYPVNQRGNVSSPFATSIQSLF